MPYAAVGANPRVGLIPVCCYNAARAIARRKPLRAKPAAVEPRIERKAIAAMIKGELDWKAWVEGLADHCPTDVAKVIDRALLGYAKAEGYDRKAPRR